MRSMLKTLNIIFTIAVVGGLMYIMWLFKWWILAISFVIVITNMVIERTTGKHTKLGTWLRKDQ